MQELSIIYFVTINITNKIIWQIWQKLANFGKIGKIMVNIVSFFLIIAKYGNCRKMCFRKALQILKLFCSYKTLQQYYNIVEWGYV